MTRRPNILLITADQWRGDSLGLMGHPCVRTPALDALATEAMVFANHFAPCAPCSPARASLYTGLYQMNHRVVANGTPLDARFDNIALAARRAGYRPTLFGYTDTTLDPRGRDPNDPELHSYEEVLPGFTCRQPLREDDRTWITWLRQRGHSETLLADPHAVPPAPDGGVSLAPPGYGPEETQTAFLVEKLLDWHAEQEAGQPWFAHVSFLRPHPPFVVPEPFASMFSPADVPAPIPLAADPHPLVRLTRDRALASNFQPGLAGTIAQLSPDDIRRIRALYYGMIAEVDAQLGRLFEALKARGDWDETLVIFTSDHGEMLGDHGLLGKGGFYSEGQHIPLMIRFPGGAAGQVEGYTSAADVFPTLLDLWGIAPGHAPDGETLMPALTGTGDVGRDWALWEFDFRQSPPAEMREERGFEPRNCHLTVLRQGKAQYIHSPAFPPVVLDLAQDPAGSVDVSLLESDLRREMAEALLTRVTTLKDETLASGSFGTL
ncbi:MAG: sulfatase-like hydrolase/transferase [Roseicyclus sp.]|nr:sulfatase-like hydrolase/transferase [Roseicyclus sp.]